jgi:hypothetical protein
MTTTNPNTAIERAEEVRELASVIFAESYGMDWTTALREADRQLDDMLAFAAEWDAAAEGGCAAPMVAAGAAAALKDRLSGSGMG